MGNEKLAQGVKELRKRKGLSQEDLAKNTGLSLRTIQRVENGETEPSGETIRRISSFLEITPNELIDWNTNIEHLKKTVKTKYEYLHIFDSKLVISTTPKIEDLVEDYGKSVNNVFKTLMVFFISIPIFTTLTVISYNMEEMGLAVHAGSFAFLFLTVAFNSMLFSSGSSLIKIENISKIKIQRVLFNNTFVISHEESGRLKKRALVLEKDQIDTMKNILLSEKLIEEKDIKLKGNKIYNLVFIAVFIILPNLLNYIYNGSENNDLMMYYGSLMILISTIMISIMVIKLIKPSFYKNNKSLA